MTNDHIIIAWAAGLFDGEGYIQVNHRVYVAIQMTDLDPLEKMQLHFGGSIASEKIRKEHYKPVWRWKISSTDEAQKFLRLIYPHLCLRRQARCNQAFAVLSRSSRKSVLIDKVTALRAEGLTHKIIAGQLGVDRSYVSHILRKL